MRLKKTMTHLSAALVIPLASPEGWQSLKFSNLKPNQVTFSNDGIKVVVEQSASPLVYPLPKPLVVKSFRVVLHIKGGPGKGAASSDWPSDSLFRIGLVAPGENKLGGARALFAASWVKQLFRLAPPGSGIDKIYFFMIGNTAEQIGKSRVHPKSELMSEEIIAAAPSSDGEITLEHKLKAPIKTAAIWISIDGDDSKSSFEVTLKSVKLEE